MCNINFVVFFLPAKVVNYVLKICFRLTPVCYYKNECSLSLRSLKRKYVGKITDEYVFVG